MEHEQVRLLTQVFAAVGVHCAAASARRPKTPRSCTAEVATDSCGYRGLGRTPFFGSHEPGLRAATTPADRGLNYRSSQ